MEQMNKPRLLAYRSFHTPLNTIEKFANAGYETICVFPAHTNNSRGTPYSQYPPVWRWYDKMDFYVFDQMIEDISRAVTVPNSAPSTADPHPLETGATQQKQVKFLLMIDLNSPVWLEHMNCYDCSDTFNNLGKAIHNPHWLNPTMTYLEAFVRYAHEKYGDQIAAYLLACGATDEWFDYSHGTEDSNRRAAWRAWQQARGRADPVDIPPQSVREHMSHEDFLRNPIEDRLALQYWQFCNESVADTILKFADATRAIVGDTAEIGCFYGYILEKVSRTMVSCGHLAYEKVLDSPNIDFLIGPCTYEDRQIGGGSGSLAPNGSAAVRGKHLLFECDQRTHTFNSYLTPYINLRIDTAWPNERATVAGLKRELCHSLIKRASMWWFDMWGDFYQGEAVMDTLAKAQAIWMQCDTAPARDVCQVAMIVDPDSTYLVNEDNPQAAQLHVELRKKLNRLGAPYEIYSFGDIPKIKNFDQYKLVIFPGLFSIDAEKQEILNRYVLRGGRHVVWMYAPGIWDGSSFCPANCAKITGAPYGEDAPAMAQMDGWSSCYLYRYETLTVELLRQLAAGSGVHMYVEEALPVYAEGNLLAIHTAQGGQRTVSVDSRYRIAKELFTGREFTIENGAFCYPFAEPDTALFLLTE